MSDLTIGDQVPRVELQPLFGARLRLPDDAAKGPIVICFVRHLGSIFARQTLSSLQSSYPDFDRHGIRLVVVTNTPEVAAYDFVPRHHLLFPVVLDPGRSIHNSFGVGRDTAGAGTIRGLLGHASPSLVWRAARHGHGLFLGDELCLPAEFVVDRTGVVAYVRRPSSVMSQPETRDLLSCARSL